MRPPNYSADVYRMFYPNAVPGDPQDLYDFGNTFLVPEIDGALSRYYGSTFCERRCRRPGVDYNDRGWRQRLCQPPFQYHRELFRIFDLLRLSPRDIEEICTWWGTNAEVDAWEARHPGRVVVDDVWEGIPSIQVHGQPRAIFHDPPLVPEPQQPPRRRASRIKRLFSRPRAITSWKDLHRPSTQDANISLPSSSFNSSQSSHEETGRLYTAAPTSDDDDVVESSVGISLNRQLNAGIRNSEFEDWLKEEAEMGRLPSTSPMTAAARATGNPFSLNTNTISYLGPNHNYGGHSYSQRMTQTSFPGDLHTLPVAVSGPSESAIRSSQPRQASLARYRSSPYQYRPIRPRPARGSG